MNPTVEILMATYNGEKYLAEQIESIRYQTYENWRLLISDDCSQDGTLVIAERYATLDPRIMIVSSDVRFGSAKANFMSLLEKSTAEYVMFCDQDDVWLDDKAERTYAVIAELEREAELDVPLLVFGDMVVVDHNLSIICDSFERYSRIDSRRTEFRQLVAQSVGAGCTMMINRAAVNLATEAKDCLDTMIMHDWWLCLVAAAFGKIGHTPGRLSLYRQHGDNELGAAKFDPVGRAAALDDMAASVEATAVQAQSFRRRYANRLSAEQSRCLDAFSDTMKLDRASSLVALVKSGCWKGGLRKLGQLTVLLRGQ